MLFYLQMPLQLLQLQQSCCFYCGHWYYHCHHCCVEVYFKIFTVASIAFANTTTIVTTAIAIVGPLLLLLAAITIVMKIDVSHQCYIYLFHFGLAMRMVIATAKAMATRMEMATAMIFHCLFHASNEMIGAIVYFSIYI
jgi:hypothetical protein